MRHRPLVGKLQAIRGLALGTMAIGTAAFNIWFPSAGGSLLRVLSLAIRIGLFSGGAWSVLKLNPWRALWAWSASAVAALVILSQFPRQEVVSIEVETIGRIVFSSTEEPPGGSLRAWFQSDAFLIPVQSGWLAGPLLEVTVESWFGGDSSASGAHVPVAMEVALLDRTWIGSVLVPQDLYRRRWWDPPDRDAGSAQ